MDSNYSKVVVEKAKELRFGPHIYPMIALVRGFCIIVDNNRFDHFPERFGSKTDACRLHQVFIQLNFAVIHEKNFTADEILHLFKNISERDELISHNCIVFIILSHGHHEVVFGTDYKEEPNGSAQGVVSIRRLIDYFSDIKCPKLKGKPKMFFFSCCRGDEYDTIETDITVFKDEFSDMFVGYATREKKVAFRNRNGSFFTYALAGVLIRNDLNLELEDIFAKVESDCREKQVPYYVDAYKKYAEQIPNYVKYKWIKKLYFNPGITLNSLTSFQISSIAHRFIIKSVILSDNKSEKLGLKCHYFSPSGPPIVYDVKSDSLASKLNIERGDIIVKVNNEWTFSDRKISESILRRNKLKNLQIILLRLDGLNSIDIRDIRGTVNYHRISNQFLSEIPSNGQLVEQGIELTQDLANLWSIALNHSKENSQINRWHYLSIDMNVFERSFIINETEPYNEKDYGISLVTDLDMHLEIPSHITSLLDQNIVTKKDVSMPWIKRLFKKR